MVEAIETTETRRSFIGPNGDTEYFINTPSAEDIRGADWQYSKTYTRCLNEGITTSAEMTDILKRRGIIGDDYNLRVRELTNELSRRIAALSECVIMEEKAELAIKVAESREELFQWNQRLSGPMSNTCEQIADDARLEFLTAAIIENESGERVWGTYDAFLTMKDQSLSMKSRYEVMLFLQGYDSDFLDQTPEARAMKEIEKSLMDKAIVDSLAEAEAEAESLKEVADVLVEEVPAKDILAESDNPLTNIKPVSKSKQTTKKVGTAKNKNKATKGKTEV